MRKIKEDYNNYRVITVYIHSDLSKIKERLINRAYNKEQIDFRRSRIEETFRDYVFNSTFFDEIIVNNSNKKMYHVLISNLINKYSSPS